MPALQATRPPSSNTDLPAGTLCGSFFALFGPLLIIIITIFPNLLIIILLILICFILLCFLLQLFLQFFFGFLTLSLLGCFA